MKAGTRVMLAGIIVTAVLAGCGKDPATVDDLGQHQAPPLPPAASMQFDLSFFQAPHGVAADPNAAQSETGAATSFNWLNATIRVAYINLVIAGIFTPPTAAFLAAIHTQPIVEDDGSFLWTYVWQDGPNHDVTIHLRGRIEGVQVNWSLRVTDPQADPPLDDFLWFYGQSNIVSNQGYWLFNNLVNNEEVLVARVDWVVRAPRDRELSFQCLDEGSDNYDDTLTYSVKGAIVSVAYFDASESLEADITWNEQTGSGSLMVPDYNNGERACWDEHQQDIECPGPAQ